MGQLRAIIENNVFVTCGYGLRTTHTSFFNVKK